MSIIVECDPYGCETENIGAFATNFPRETGKSEVVEPDLSGYSENERRLIRILLALGLTWEEILRGMRYPFFLRHVSVILNASMGMPIEERLALLRRVLAKIDQTSDEKLAAGKPSDTKAAKPDQPAKPQKKKREKNKAERQPNNATLRRLSIFAALWNCEAIDIQNLAALTGFSERRLRDALNDLHKAGLIGKTTRGRTHYYFLTHEGVVYLRQNLRRTFLQSQLPSPFGTGLCRNVRDSLLDLIRKAQQGTRELAKMGWWYRAIQWLFHAHKLDYISSWIKRAKNNSSVVKTGAYLWTVLMKEKSDEERKEAMTVKILAGIEQNLVDVFRDEVTHAMSCRQALRFALAVRSFHRKCARRSWTFSVGDVRGIAGWIRKQSA